MDDYLAKPVRLEDIRAIVERWGSAAGSAETSGEAPRPQTAASNGSVPATTPTPAEAPPVEMERLLDFTDGNPDNLKELVMLYLNQTSEQMGQLDAAVRAGSAQEVRRLAHSCAGASATCGVRQLVPILRELERQGSEEKLTTAADLCQQAGREFQRIRIFLEDYLARHCDLAAKPSA
jgi:HPt (histidine-containing phosphotransfer) domain-containing protein